MTKVRLEVIKPWVTERITAILGIEDDVVIEYVFNQLEAEKVSVVTVVEGGQSHCQVCVPFLFLLVDMMYGINIYIRYRYTVYIFSSIQVHVIPSGIQEDTCVGEFFFTPLLLSSYFAHYFFFFSLFWRLSVFVCVCVSVSLSSQIQC